MPYNDTTMTIGEHFGELRRRLIRALLGVGVGMAICLFYGDHLFAVILWPLAVATGGHPPQLHPRTMQEAFMTYLRVCLISGAVLASPYSLHQMWQFIAAGLYERERRTVRRYVLPSIVLFIVGVAFYFVVVAPIVMRFFLNFAQTSFPEAPRWGVASSFVKHLLAGKEVAVTTRPVPGGGSVVPLLTLTDYVSFVTTLAMVFGLSFQTPLVVMFLGRSGMVAPAAMRRSRPYVFLVILILAAFITPPDIISQLALAGPMYLLFELGLLFAHRRKER